MTKGADHGARNELHSLIKGNLIQIPGSQDQLLQPEVEDDGQPSIARRRLAQRS